MSGAHACAGTVKDRVWTLQELSILHELHNPVAVVVYGLFDSSHRHAFGSSTSALPNISELYHQVESIPAVLAACKSLHR